MRCFRSMKSLFYVVASTLVLILTYFSLKDANISSETLFYNKIVSFETGNKKKVKKLHDKYILQWTSSKSLFSYMGFGRKGFVDRNCTYTNCFVTSNRLLLGGLQKFDVIAFAGQAVIYYGKKNLPRIRSPHQKYAFVSGESSDRFPICANYFNDFFNWTWTYKTNSDARWGYIIIRDSDGILIGPNSIMHWMKFEDMNSVSNELKEKLKSKNKAVAWFVSRCYSKSRREIFVQKLQDELTKYNLKIDIYGRCGPFNCSREDESKCLKMLEENYYFYLSFENSFSEDYVTEKLLYALQHNTIPIVYGAANYTRFMPDGIYLNARKLGAQKLAEKINELILNLDNYAEYFRWQNHYSYHSRNEHKKSDDFCSFCAILNDKRKVKKVSRYKNMKKWWNPPNRC